MDARCSVVVSSCDAYSDVWPVFFTLFFRYWPDCPFPVYLVSESKTYPDSRVRMIHLGEDKKWATNIRKALRSIPTPVIIPFQEDYILVGKTDTARILRLLDIFKKHNAAYLKLWAAPMPTKAFEEYRDIGEIEKGSAYSVSLLPAIWDKGAFESLLVDGESAWDMELKGSARSVNVPGPLLSVYDNAVNCFYATAIKKGMWFYDAAAFCRREGIVIDADKRRVETKREYLIRRAKMLPIIGRPFAFILRQIGKIKMSPQR